MDLEARLNEVVSALNAIEKAYHKAKGYTHAPDFITWEKRRKFIAIDFGGSGAFLVEVATGELYNIKGYGVPNYNKKQKANLGNIFSVDPTALHGKRWNYLR